jgi:hypothetical protein
MWPQINNSVKHIFLFDFLTEQKLLWELFQIKRCKHLPIYAKSRKVAGSIPNKIIGFLNWPNLSSSTMALRPTQPLTQMSTRNLPGGKGRPARKADLTAICEPIV